MPESGQEQATRVAATIVTAHNAHHQTNSHAHLPRAPEPHRRHHRRSVFLFTKAAIPSIKRSKAGRIINVASISGRTVFANSSPAYGAAKAGVIQFTRFLAYQLGPAGITSNAIAPITTLTPRVAARRTQEDVERIASQVPLRRLAVPEDHAQAMLFLASDGAAYLNGVTLDINGGRVMM